jgi:hypothetical protein
MGIRMRHRGCEMGTRRCGLRHAVDWPTHKRGPSMWATMGPITTGCSGRSAARPAAEPERWTDGRPRTDLIGSGWIAVHVRVILKV